MAVLGERGGRRWLAPARWRDASWWRVAASRRWQLAGLCVGLNLLESSLVGAYGHGSPPDLAPQASAVAPFGVFGDLRWVSVYHDSWWTLAAELAGTLFVRGFLTALSISLAWPHGTGRPALGTLARRGVLGTGLAAVFLLPSVALLFGVAVVPVSWLFLAAVPTALLVAVLLHPAAVSADWWKRVVSLRAVAWVIASFLALSLSSAAMTALPWPCWPLIAVLSGLFNAWSWVGLVHAVVDRRPVHHMVPVAALTTLLVACGVVGGAVLGFSDARPAIAGPVHTAAPARHLVSTEPAVLIVSGYGSDWGGEAVHPVPGPYVEERFSYRGLAPDGQPLPYVSSDTAKPIAELDRMLIKQVASLHARTGQEVAVVSESEGALVAKTALLAQPDRDVKVLVMASPLESVGRVSYPTTGNDGWGVASNAAMRLISDAFQGVAPIDLSPDNPLFASLDHEAPLLENAMSCALPGTHQFAMLPLADATVTPAAESLPYPSVVLPAFHGGLLETASGQRDVGEVLRSRPVSSDHLLVLADDAIRDAATAWQVPSLVLSDYPGSAPGRNAPLGCRRTARQLHALVFGR